MWNYHGIVEWDKRQGEAGTKLQDKQGEREMETELSGGRNRAAEYYKTGMVVVYHTLLGNHWVSPQFKKIKIRGEVFYFRLGQGCYGQSE